MTHLEPDRPLGEELGRGRYVSLTRSAEGWECVHRLSISGIVSVIAVTGDRQLILVEQWRPPVGARVLELPSGTAEDDEPLLHAAKRELLEETGYESSRWSVVADITTSPGLTDEVVRVFRADNARKIGPGGGRDDERIDVRSAGLDQVHEFLGESSDRGLLIDGKVLLAAEMLGVA